MYALNRNCVRITVFAMLMGVIGLVPAAKAQSTSDLLPFTGTWSGSLSGLSVDLAIFENNNLLNVTAWIGGQKQTLSI